MPRTLLALSLCVAAITGSAALASTDGADPVERYVTAIAARQEPCVAEALARMDDPGRQLLALRAYLRSRNHLAERWSWTAERIAAYESSPEYADLQAQIERVRLAFVQSSPGYELWVNPQVRSLDIQLEHWNTNESVAAAAANLLDAARARVAAPDFSASDPVKAVMQLEEFLASYVPEPTPTIAAPGLSPHGQMRAVDFQVHRRDTIVAGTRTATIATDWDAAGWTAKLAEAVREAGTRFIGPLESPREPWHYSYAPESVAAR